MDLLIISFHFISLKNFTNNQLKKVKKKIAIKLLKIIGIKLKNYWIFSSIFFF